MLARAYRPVVLAVTAALCLTAMLDAQDLSAPRTITTFDEALGPATVLTPPGVPPVFINAISETRGATPPTVRRLPAGLTGPVPDWRNNVGNSALNGQSSHAGPALEDILWDDGPASVISWQPVIEGQRVFVVRQTGFPPAGEPNGS